MNESSDPSSGLEMHIEQLSSATFTRNKRTTTYRTGDYVRPNEKWYDVEKENPDLEKVPEKQYRIIGFEQLSYPTIGLVTVVARLEGGDCLALKYLTRARKTKIRTKSNDTMPKTCPPSAQSLYDSHIVRAGRPQSDPTESREEQPRESALLRVP